MGLYLAADKNEIASNVLLTDDPLRVKMIVANYLEDASCYNEIRGMFGYTGTYKGKRISVQSFGIGAPALSIYVHELLEEYEVKRIVYIGTCVSVSEDLKNRDVILAQSASSDISIANLRFKEIIYTASADFHLLSKAFKTSANLGINCRITNVFSTDFLNFPEITEKAKLLSTYGIKAFDMETWELYTLAAKYNAKALSILTVSDELFTGKRTSPAERQTTFHDMIKLAFETI